MNRYDVAFVMAGVIGSISAIVHGVLTQRHLVRPVQELTAAKLSRTIRRLLTVLLQFSAFAWLAGGIALIVAARSFGEEARFVTGVLVGSLYAFATAGNLWATRGRHPGWVCSDSRSCSSCTACRGEVSRSVAREGAPINCGPGLSPGDVRSPAAARPSRRRRYWAFRSAR